MPKSYQEHNFFTTYNKGQKLYNPSIHITKVLIAKIQCYSLSVTKKTHSKNQSKKKLSSHAVKVYKTSKQKKKHFRKSALKIKAGNCYEDYIITKAFNLPLLLLLACMCYCHSHFMQI